MVPDWLPDFVRKRMAEEIAQDARSADWLAVAKGMTLYGTIGHEVYLRPDGTVWFHHAVDWVNDPDTWAWSQATLPEAWGAFLIAAKRIPEVARLVPERPTTAPDCADCLGTGRHVVGIQCPTCHGLGWPPSKAV